MNPLRIARQLREDYLTLLRTTFSPRQDRLREEFNRQIEREGFLTREPFISLSQPYQHAAALDGLLPETKSRFGHVAERPYAHQAEAVQRITRDLPTVIATGTGSGKTEAFLIPIVDHCLRHRGESGLKAIIVYPMNALANDQLRRVRELLGGSGVSFGRYTGETQLRGQRPADAPEEERVTRPEFRSNPPDIILTNYQMLDYMLLRGDGRDIFRGHRVKFIVLDEVHTYHGALGTDVACLLRRLRASLASSSSGNASPLFIGTSATLQSGGDEGDPRSGVAGFFSQLTGQETSAEAVIIESFDPPKEPEGFSLPPAPGITKEELEQFDAENPDVVLSLARRLTGADRQDSRTLEELWESSLLPYLLFQWLERPLSLSEIVQKLSEQPGREGLDTDHLRREIEAALLVGPCLPDSHALRLRPRVHRFLRGLARFWRCTNPECGRLLDEGVGSCSSCGARSLPLAICRTCGWDFFVGITDSEGPVTPWLERSSSGSTLFLYDPPTARIDVDEEDNPLERAEEEGETEIEDEDMPEEAETVPEAEAYLCSQCLSLSESAAARVCTCDDSARLRPVKRRATRSLRKPWSLCLPLVLCGAMCVDALPRTTGRDLLALGPDVREGWSNGKG